MLEQGMMAKIAEKAVKQPKIAIRRLKEIGAPQIAILAVREYEMNRGTQAESIALENMRATLRRGQ